MKYRVYVRVTTTAEVPVEVEADSPERAKTEAENATATKWENLENLKAIEVKGVAYEITETTRRQFRIKRGSNDGADEQRESGTDTGLAESRVA